MSYAASYVSTGIKQSHKSLLCHHASVCGQVVLIVNLKQDILHNVLGIMAIVRTNMPASNMAA